jgi:hypothetical protein
MSQRIQQINVWIQIFTSVGVIAGLGLVVWALQLTRSALYDQYALTNLSDASSDLNAVYGERAADVLAKACFKPAEMTDADLIVLEHYFTNKLYRIFNLYWQSSFLGNDNWKGPASSFLMAILRYPQGRAFLEHDPYTARAVEILPALVPFFDEQRASAIQSCKDAVGALKIEPPGSAEDPRSN